MTSDETANIRLHSTREDLRKQNQLSGLECTVDRTVFEHASAKYHQGNESCA